jgi:zinc protease
MTRRTGLILVGAGALLGPLAPAPALAQARSWQEIQKPPLRPFTMAKPLRVVLPNGMVLFLMEDRELPLVSAYALVRGGSRLEPADKAGLASVFGQVWRTGGTAKRTGDDLDDFLEARAAKVETGGGLTSVSLSLSCLKGDFDDVLGVFVEVLREPAFAADKIDIAKNQLNTGIARRNDDPMGIAEREARKLAYGAASPYARQTEYATVAAITRDDLLAWHKKHVHPDRTVMGVVGDFDTKAMEAKLRKVFGPWPRGPAATDAPATWQAAKPGYYLVEKEDVNQTNIRMVHLGIRRDDPDYFALEVMNEVLGGGFSSRLFSNVRSKKGLAYGVWGGVGSDYDYPGYFQVAMGTKSESTAAGIDALVEEVKDIVDKPATEEELNKAKDSILNSFVFRFDSKAKILNQQVTYEFFGYPPDFLERYRREIEKVTAADVARVARKHVHRDQLAVLVVGKPADFDKPLATYGAVTKLDIAIPPPPGEKKAAATDVTKAAGRELLRKAAAAFGSADTLAGVKDVRVKGRFTMKTPQGDMTLQADVVMAYPDRMYQQIQSPMGAVTMVVAPSGSFMSNPMGTQDMPGSMKEEMAKALRRSSIAVARKAADPDLAVSLGGKEKVGEVEAAVLDISYEGMEVRWFVDPSTGRLLRASYQTVGPQGPGTRVSDYSDFRPVEGLTLPFKEEVTFQGEKAQTLVIEELKLNSSPDPKLFEKPAAPEASAAPK